MSFSKISAACIVVAVLLNILPWFGGPNWIWSLLLLGGAAWMALGKTKASHLVLWALVVTAHALDNLYIGIDTLPWLGGAFFALRAVAPLLDFSTCKRGYAPYAVVGAALCLWTPFWTWGKVDGWSSSTWMGGFDYNLHTDINGDLYGSMDYNAIKYLMPLYSPGYDWTGRAETGWFNATLIVLAILGWTVWRDQSARHRLRLLPVVGALFLLVWSFPALNSGYGGPYWFVLGALGIGFCALMALRGQQSGALDAAFLFDRFKTEIAKRKVAR